MLMHLDFLTCHWEDIQSLDLAQAFVDVRMQSTVGVLVGKTLTSSSTSPYTASGVRNAAPAALDVFSVQVGLGFPSKPYRYCR